LLEIFFAALTLRLHPRGEITFRRGENLRARNSDSFVQDCAGGAGLAEEGVGMIRRLYATDDSTATSILRLVLGIVFFAHGAQKMLGWFGGPGFSGTIGYFTGTMHIPGTLAFLEIAAEFFGAIGLILGFLTRIAAFGIGVIMLVAVMTVHHAFGFFN
jgi:uncharacterized membrane protein YphA (DoxX/SURF4 family)